MGIDTQFHTSKGAKGPDAHDEQGSLLHCTTHQYVVVLGSPGCHNPSLCMFQKEAIPGALGGMEVSSWCMLLQVLPKVRVSYKNENDY